MESETLYAGPLTENAAPAGMAEGKGPAAPAEPDADAGFASAQSSAQSPARDLDARIADRLREQEAAQQMQWQAQISQWRQEVAQDPDLGGENLAASVARAQLALDRFDQDKSIGRLLEETGYGNHPAVVRFFNRMADALMEDSPAQGLPDGGMPPLEERMYAGWSSGNEGMA